MLIQNLKIALRNILRNKLTSIINIAGLSISIASCSLIIFFIRYELSYDRFNVNADRIYRFTYSINTKSGYSAHFARCANSWIRYLPGEFPEVEKMVTLIPYRHITLKIKEEKLTLTDSFYADSTFFNVFSVPLLQGDSNKVLSEPNTVVISESFARKYFGNKNPVGQSIVNTGWYDGSDWSKLNLTITGVFRDLPANSHFHSDIFISKTTNTVNNDNDWKYVYILFNKHARPDDFIQKFPAFLNKHVDEENNAKDIVPDLQCITDIHLKSDKDREIEQNGNMTVIYIMGLVGLIILIISWVNYLNLNIARVYSHRKSVILYKIHGGSGSIFFQYFIESLIINFLSFYIAYILITLFFPALVTITGSILNEQIFQSAIGTYKWLLLIFVTSLIIGCVPIIVFIMKLKTSVSLLRPINSQTKNKPSAFFRKSLIIFQFTLTIILIISTLIINSQSKYILNHQTGAKHDSVLVINLFNQDILSKYTLLKSELLKCPYIKDATAIFEEPYDLTMDAMGFETAGIKEENKDKILWIYVADDNYFKFNEVPFIAGSDFPPFNKNLKREYYVLNETAVRELGWTPEEAVGKPFKLKFTYGENIIFGGEITGVVKDFNVNTLHHEIKPFVFFQKEIWFWKLLIKIDMEQKQPAMKYLKDKWDQISPDYPLSYKYNTDIFFQAYKKEIVQSRLTGFFSILAIIISCLGLFAISSIIILQRTKEIGIRKVNGSVTSQIMYMITTDFTKSVIIAFAIACPVAWYAMHKWLQSFAYKTELSLWIFVLAGFLAVAVAFITVSYQSWRAASKNPVEALRYE
jgi:putative ABC transport system permease protein